MEALVTVTKGVLLNTSGILDTEISFFPKYTDTTNPTTGTFLQIVTSEKLAAQFALLAARIRETADKKERDRLKKKLPCFTPSGTFSHRAADGLIKHSGLLQFDVDPKENPFLNSLTAPRLKEQISNLRQIAYCALSASGTGIWGVVPIAHPDRHREHFAALAADFAGWGIILDNKCGNVDRLRFWSYDPEAWINPDAATYTKLTTGRPEPYTPAPRRHIESSDAVKVEAILQQIETTRTDITGSYENWFAAGCALANEFGESGRDYFHSIGQFHPEYSPADTDRQFSYCLRMKSNRYTLGTFFEIARRCGIEYKGHLPRPFENRAHAAPQPPTAPQPTPSALPPGYRRERFTDSGTGHPFEVLLNGDGYPAAWDLPDDQRDSLTRMIQQNPAVTELIARFDLK